jgi:hypothetical protein
MHVYNKQILKVLVSQIGVQLCTLIHIHVLGSVTTCYDQKGPCNPKGLKNMLTHDGNICLKQSLCKC